eukprot:8585983-Lingulodinium_polyedra.AAC.1
MRGHSLWLLARLAPRSQLRMAQHLQGHRRPAALGRALPPGTLPASATRRTTRQRVEPPRGPRG